MASPYVANTDQLTANLMQLIQGNKQNTREDQLRQQTLKREQDRKKLVEASAQALALRELPSYEQKRTGLLRLAQNAIQQGGDPSSWEKLTEIQDVDELNLALRQMAINAETAGKFISDQDRKSGIKSFAPVTIINKDTNEKRLVSPAVDPNTGEASLKAFEMPKGFEISTETPEEKRAADVLATGEKEKEKLSAQLEFKPAIESAVTEARSQATNRGEVFTEYKQAKAALPGLKTAVDELRELAQIATSTIGGRIFDTAVKETGFGATEGATARAKFIAIVNNQVLPLLKPTFGAAFTVQEGEALKATMGDPNATPEEKMVQLDAFIAQKLRDIETKEAQINPEQATPQAPATGGIKFLGFE